MYGYEWTDKNGIFRLSVNVQIPKEIRPVFREELDYFGFSKFWSYPSDTQAPLLWAEGIRRYMLNGECVAEAVGGGYYTKPEIRIKRKGLTLEPIDLAELWKVNERLMLGLEKTAMNFIRRTYDRYSAKGMSFTAAFSGGKDSLVVLDLVSRVLAPDEFYVIFSDTGMEISPTYEAVARAKAHWPELRFRVARSHFSPEQSWEEFGPPGRRMRWCCHVHKSVPTILLMRELTGNYDVKAVVFDGIRAEESAQRSGYDDISIGKKSINQINCSPILKWSAPEVYMYLMHHKILLNDAYRLGLFRVGCSVCPMSSGWKDSIVNHVYPDDTAPLLRKIEEYADNAGIRPSQKKSYIENIGWRARMGGKALKNGGNRVNETTSDDRITFSFTSHTQNWLEVCKILGPVVQKEDDTYTQIIDSQQFTFTITENPILTVTYWPYSRMDRFVVSHLREIANKTAYCIGCRTCEVQCPVNAFAINEDGHIYIREENCIHCYNCLMFIEKGCWAAKSLSITGGGNMKGINRYQTFGFRRVFLEHFFQYKEKCFTMQQFGTRQYDALKVWLRESTLIIPAAKGSKSGTPSALFDKLQPLGAGNPLTWAVIWTHLAYNSTIVRWYVHHTEPGEIYDKQTLVYMLGDDYSQSTRDNAITALLETFRHSPVGSVLKQGIPIQSGSSYRYSKQGWETPDAVAVLYALYVWAEETGRYEFTLTQMEAARGKPEAVGVDPVSIFGLAPNRFKNILQDIALNFEKYIRTTFVADLDNVQLFPEYTSLDILDLAAK